MTGDVQPSEIASGVYWLRTGGERSWSSNVYFVRSGASWTLIDAGWPNCAPAIRAAAERLFGEHTRPAAVLVTHLHPDHSGSALELAQTWGVPVLMHPLELPQAGAEYLPEYANPLDRWLIEPLLRVLPRGARQRMLAQGSLGAAARVFDPDAGVPGLPDWECIPAPGHTPGHVAYYRPSDRVLISGDALVAVNLNSLWDVLRGTQKISNPPRYTTWRWPAAKESAAALARLEPRVLASGHGKPMTTAAILPDLRAFSGRQTRRHNTTARGTRWWTPADMPAQTGRTAVVTGADSGIGFQTALELSRAGARVVLACRNAAKAADAVRRIRAQVPHATVEPEVVDLADLRSIRSFASRLLEDPGAVDLLVNNAGVMGAPTRWVTTDGFELQFGTNHLGHFALTGLLLPALLARPGARVVTVTSKAHEKGRIRFDDLQAERGYGPWAAYSQSKLANLLFALELDRWARARQVDLLSVAVHPGLSSTGLQSAGPGLGHTGVVTRARLSLFRLIGHSAAQAALPTLYAATDPDVVGGAFYGPGGPGGIRGGPCLVHPAPPALDMVVARRLWDVSEQLTGVRFASAFVQPH